MWALYVLYPNHLGKNQRILRLHQTLSTAHKRTTMMHSWETNYFA